MKILQIINTLGTGGAEKLLLDTIPLYRKAGIEMDILLFWDNDLPFAKELKNKNICTIHILNTSKTLKDIYKLQNIIKLKGILKKYDLAHVHLFPAQYFTPLSNSLNCFSTKLIFSEHNTFNKRINTFGGRILDHIFYNYYKKVVFISKDVQKVMLKNYPALIDKSILIENGVDLIKMRSGVLIDWSTFDASLNSSKKVLLQVSAFREAKDQKTLIKSLLYLPEEYVVVLAGDGITMQDCKNFTKQLNLQKRVFFIGVQLNIANLLKSAEVVVLSSKFEGLSLASLEGMASGRPFVASDVPGLSEIVKGYGELFPYNDAEALATTIKKLENDRFRDEVISRCLKRVQDFDIHKTVDKYIELYTDIFNSE